MTDLADDRPVLTLVMGCDGAGKTAWRDWNREQLPGHYFDVDILAGGIGDRNSRETRGRALEYVNAEIDKVITARLDFGTETSYAGDRGPDTVRQMLEHGYRIDGIYIGTETPEINIERVAHRVRSLTGHHVDAERIRERHPLSLQNLRKDAAKFDRLVVLDNSVHHEDRRPRPTTQCILDEKGQAQEEDEPDAA